MRFLSLMLFSLILLQSNLAQAKDKLVATPINSPVKETYLKVSLQGFDSISEVLFKPKSGGVEAYGEVVKEGSTFIGKFKGSFLKPGKYEYRVKIRTASGKSQQDEAASVAFINFEIDSSLGVADPGEEGKKTLAGIDIDKDGVRDDVQRWINEEYPLSILPSTNQALKQKARKMQLVILNADNRTAAIQAAGFDSEAIYCLGWIKGEGVFKLSKLSRARFYNNSERIKANLKVQEYLRGSSQVASVKALSFEQHNQLCDFAASKEQ